MKKALIFDLDGTLWNASQAIIDSWNDTLEHLGIKKNLSMDYIQSLQGLQMDEIARKVFPEYPEKKAFSLMEKLEAGENAYVEEHGGDLYPKLRETLEKLKDEGRFMAIVSNCQKGYIEAFYTAHGMEDLFDDQECYGNTLVSKDQSIRILMKRNGIEDAWYIGDIEKDYKAASGADIGFIHANYGFGQVDGVPQLEQVCDLPDLLADLEEKDHD